MLKHKICFGHSLSESQFFNILFGGGGIVLYIGSVFTYKQCILGRAVCFTLAVYYGAVYFTLGVYYGAV